MHRAELTINVGSNSKEYSSIVSRDIGIDGITVKLSSDKKKINAVIESEDSRKLLEAMGSLVKELRVIDSVWKIVR